MEGIIWVSIFYGILAFFILHFDFQGMTLFQIQELRTRFLVSFFVVSMLSIFLEHGFRHAQKRLFHHQSILKESENRYRQAYEQLNVEMQEREQAEEAATRLSQENAVVAEIGRIISSTLDIKDVYERFAEKVRELIPFNRITIHIIDFKVNTMHIAYVTGLNVAFRVKGGVFPLTGTFIEEAIRTRTNMLIQIEDLKKVTDRFPELLPNFQAGIRSFMAIPLISKDEVIGILHIQSTQPNAYSERDLSLAEKVGNQIAGAIANAQLFAGHKRAGEELRENKERLQALMDASPVCISWSDLEGNIEYVNRKFRELFGYTIEDIPTVAAWRRLAYPDPAYREKVPLLYAMLREPQKQGKEVLITELAITCKDGSTRYVEQMGSLVANRVMVIYNDITERKRYEESLKEKTEELARSNRDLEQFAYVASHDLQEPLRMVTNYVQLLARRYKGKLDPDADDFINFAVDGALRMWRLINDLLTYSRVGTQSKGLQSTDCETVLQHSLDNLKVAIEESEAVITHDSLPTVMGDPLQLGQLFQNLIGNALKFRGKEPPRVHISARRNGGGWTFSVRDNGIGIAPEYAKRIFVIFQRLHNREEYPGTGIGLAICKKIVERHGGRIWADSEVGKGTTFYFTLQVSKEEQLSS
jgi:PAS domain S-box-containing protein